MSQSPANDRRRRQRLKSTTQGWLLPESPLTMAGNDGDEAWEIRVEDLSRLGVGFTTTEPLRLGHTCRLRIGRGPVKRSKLIRVVSCREEWGAPVRTYRVGCEFVATVKQRLPKKAA